MLRECLIGADRPYPSFRVNTVMFAPVLSGWAEIGNAAVPGHAGHAGYTDGALWLYVLSTRLQHELLLS